MAHPIIAGAPGEKHLLLGNEAIVRGALEAGVQVVTCYPGTPSSEVPDTFYKLSPDGDYYFEYSVNEKVALEVGGGAALSGAMTLVTMKHVGVNVAADPLMTLCYIGAPGGLVLLSADDPGCHSSQNEQDNRIYCRLAGMPCLEPATAQEAKDMARAALTLSRRWQQPFMLRTTTRLNHLRGPVELAEPEVLEPPAGFRKTPGRFVPIPAVARVRHGELLKNLTDIAAAAEASPFNRVRGEGEVGVVASGISRAYLHDVIAEHGLEDSLKVLELGFSYPLPEGAIADFAQGLSRLVVIEEGEPVVETEIRALAQRLGIAAQILGKTGEALPGLTRLGEYSTASVARAVLTALGREAAAPVSCAAPRELPTRPPNLCAGCPHRAAFFAVREAFGDDAVYSSDIGCYTLGILPPLSAADFLLCMGSSVSAGGGAALAAGQTVVAFIGDSTFFHSGMTGLVNAVFNNHDLLLVILDNRTTAMTGHQPNPGVDTTIHGANPSMLDIEAVVRGLGVSQLRTVNPLNRKATRQAVAELKALRGVRVLLASEPCPLHARRLLDKKFDRVAYVAEQSPEVLDCLRDLACPAFSLDAGAVRIDEAMCSGCMFCLQFSKDIKARARSK